MKQTSWVLNKSKNSPLEIYQELVNRQKKTENRWKVFAYISIGGFILSMCCLVYAVNLPKTVPVIVTLNDFGEAKYLGEVKVNYSGIKVPEIAIEYQLRKFVTNKFTIPGDREVLKNNLKDCYACLTSETAAKLSSELKDHNPLKDVEVIRKKVKIESVLNLTKNSYQVDFIVTQSNPYNMNIVEEKYRGVLTTTMLEPNDEDKILNPLGIYIKAYDFTKVK